MCAQAYCEGDPALAISRYGLGRTINFGGAAILAYGDRVVAVAETRAGEEPIHVSRFGKNFAALFEIQRRLHI